MNSKDIAQSIENALDLVLQAQNELVKVNELDSGEPLFKLTQGRLGRAMAATIAKTEGLADNLRSLKRNAENLSPESWE
jgi:hypothetical protein